MNSKSGRQTVNRLIGLSCIIVATVWVDYALVFSQYSNVVAELIVFGILIGQCSSAVGLISLQIQNRWLRILSVALIGYAFWYLIVRAVLMYYDGETWAIWAVIIAVHICLMMTVMRLPFCHRDVRSMLRLAEVTGPTGTGLTETGLTETGPTETGPTETGPTETGPTGKGVGNIQIMTLIEWTTISALVFAIAQLGVQLDVWDRQTLSLAQIGVLSGYGSLTVVVSWLGFVVAASQTPVRFVLRLIASAVVLFALVILVAYLCFLTDLSSDFAIRQFLLMVAAQWITVGVMIAMVRLALSINPQGF